ncbi:MAG: hypothetical protein OHK0046_08890 [Anaerolineae bacterium]
MVDRERRYSHHARRALTHAKLLVKRYRHPRVDTGHLLVGVMLTKGSMGCTLLAEMGLAADTSGEALESLTLPLDHGLENPLNDAALDTALELAADESVWLGHHYIGTEHFLLGITRTNVGNASDLLRLLDTPAAQLRRRVRKALSDGLTEDNLRRDASLSELSRRVINAAEQMAVAMDHPTVGLGHLLLVLLSERRSMTSALLHQAVNDQTRLQALVEHQDALALVSIEGVMMQAVEQAEHLGSHYTGTEHLLLALCADESGAALITLLGAAPAALTQSLEEKLLHLR